MSRFIIAALAAALPGCATAAPPAPAVVPAEQAVSAQPPARVAPVVSASASAPAAHRPARDRPGIAVFPFTNGGSYGRNREDLSAMAVGIQGMLLTELQQNPELRIVDRGILRPILDEQGLVPGGRVDPETAAQIGKVVGARYAVTGTFMDLDGNFRLDGWIVDVETSEVLHAVRIQGEQRENLYRMLVDLAQRVMDGVELPPLAAAARQERDARNVPDEAVLMLSLAMDAEDDGRSEEAVELYRQVVRRFPDYTEAREALQQIEEG
jgi:TolB-like protein